MALDPAFFPGAVTADEWARNFVLLSYEGTFGVGVTAAAGDRTVHVTSFRAAGGGKFARDESSTDIQFDENPGQSWSRIDRLVVRWDHQAQTVTLTPKKGTPALNPSKPTLTKEETGVYELSLAAVTIGPGQGAFTANDIELEAIPRQRPFYYISSIATAPDPAHSHGLMYYTSDKSLYVGTDAGWVKLADSRPPTATSGTAGAGWSGGGTARKAGRVVKFRARPIPTNNQSSTSLACRVPIGYRPPDEIDTVGWQSLPNGSARMHGVVIQTDGQVYVTPGEGGPIVSGRGVRFSETWILADPLEFTTF